MGLGWWLCWHSIPRTNGKILGGFVVAGKPVRDARVFIHSADGQFRGAQIVDGMFVVDHVPAGKYRVTFDGQGVPTNLVGCGDVIYYDDAVCLTFCMQQPKPAATVAGSAKPIYFFDSDINIQVR